MPVRWTDPTRAGEVYTVAFLKAVRHGASVDQAREAATKAVERQREAGR